MKRKRMVFVAGAVALVALLAIGGVATVFAAGSTTTSGTSRGQEFLNRLANNLGITPDKLQQGLKTTADQEIDNAVANGRITQDQANKAKQNVDNGNGLSAFTRFFGRRIQDRDLLRFGTWNDLASELGMSPQDLSSQLKAGKTLKQIISDQNKTVDDVVNAVAAKVQQTLDAQVTAGKLSQSREATILANLKTRLTDVINNGGPTPHTHGGATPSGVSG
jgi:3-hydroxyacyl-CoA dehydrogenase